eukprot:jgi/Phyca11/19596/fgenesh1_pg.PHYCAscaffold_50_\
MIDSAKKTTNTEALGLRLQNPDEVFKLYDLNYAGRRILSTSQFSAWTNDDELFHIALAAKRSGETEAMGAKLEDAFVQFWIRRKETPDNVLVELGLKKSMETLLENPLLNILTKYTEVYNVNYAAKKTTVIETLTRTFGDDKVARMLLAGRRESTTTKIAKQFQTDQLEMWLSSGQSVDDVYRLLNLPSRRDLVADIGYNKLFGTWLTFMNAVSLKNPEKMSAIFTSSPLFKKWMLYVEDLDKKNPSNEYGDDTLYKMIDSAKKTTNTEALGLRLQNPDEVFKLYDLNYAGRRILSTSQFSAWTKYVDDLNAKNEGAFVLIVPTLRKYFSDDELFHIALAAKRSGETEAMGAKLEDAFVQFWTRRKDTPDNVLVELGLKKSMETLLESPLLNILTKYTEVYNVNYAAKKTTVIETLTRTFGDDKVARMLLAGRTESTTKKIAKQFQTDQLEMWLSSGQSVDDVYKLLNLPSRRDLLSDFGNQKLFNTWVTYINTVSLKNPEKTVGESVLSSPLFKKWMLYVEDFNKKNPGKEESWYMALRGSYQGGVNKIIDKAMKDPSTMKIASLAQKEQLNEALTRWKYSPEKLFRFLNVGEAGEKVFSAPKFELWVKYLDDWNNAYPSKKTTMIDGLVDNYHISALVPMLAAAEKVPSTKKLASQLQDALVEKWVAEKKTMAYLKPRLKGVPSSDDMLERYTKKLNIKFYCY